VAGVSNGVTPQCLVVEPPAPPPVAYPTLTKRFGQDVIVDGERTTLIFTMTQDVIPLTVQGGRFQDILPDGLIIGALPEVMFSGGCAANVSFTSSFLPHNNIVNVESLVIPDTTAVCTITVAGLTNRPDYLNPTECGGTNAPNFTNTRFRISDAIQLTNAVSPQCLRVLGAAPKISKRFTDARIYDGDTTTLVIDVTNSARRPAVVGATFSDTLPSGLRFLSTASVGIQGAGCTGTARIVGNSVVVTGFAMAAGTESCAVVATRVTNAPNQLNGSCTSNPAAFTNSASSISGLAGVHNFVQPACLVVEALNPLWDLAPTKSISRSEGFSPSGTYSITIAFNNTIGQDAVKTNFAIADALPAGMRFVPGSLRLTLGGASAALTESSGSVEVDGRSVSYNTAPAQVGVSIASVGSGESGSITFSVTIAPGLAVDTLLANTAQFTYLNSAGRPMVRPTNTVLFRVLGALGVTITGQTLAEVEPGQEAVFRNVVTNIGNVVDTYDITLSGSTFPAGTSIRLFGADGVTSLADSSGNGVPDTGAVAPGESRVVIVRVLVPLSAKDLGPFRVRKTARSVRLSTIEATDDDILLAVKRNCLVVLEPDNNGKARPASAINYFHVLTNTGNCVETVAGWSITSGLAGWGATTKAAFWPSQTGGQPSSGSNEPGEIVLQPGESAGFTVDISVPRTARNGDVSTSVFSVTSVASAPKLASARKDAVGASRTLTNRDVTTVDGNATNLPTDVIRPYIDGNYRRPTLFGYIGQMLFIRAEAPSCNAVPDVIERRTIIITGPNGEREEIIAIETGPNTGLFDASIPVRTPPVQAGSGIIEGNADDTYLVEIVGCGRRIATTVILIDPNGIVFDSQTNQPVAGATVRALNAVGGVCTTTLATVQMLSAGSISRAPNPVVTKEDGKFDFPLVAPGDYCIEVRPPNGYSWTSIVPFDQLPRGRNILATGPTSGGSYGGSFRVGPETGPVILDIPVDPGRLDGLFIRKDVNRPIVELGEFADYTVTIVNQTGVDLIRSPVFASDSLPAGFAYVLGTARVEGKPIADPEGGAGPRLRFNIGSIAAGGQVKLTYRVRVGPGALQGDGVNRVVAAYRIGERGQYSESNVATAKVTVTAGVFTDRAYVVGKVFADCSKDGLQRTAKQVEDNEIGVPGVRLMLEDGTSAVTDAEGKYSFYGLVARTRVLKIDRTSLPDGVELAELEVVSNRNLGKADSRILDLKNGELHKANFAITGCAQDIYAAIETRRRLASSVSAELDGQLQQKLATDTLNRAVSDVKALPASGTLGQVLAPVNSGATAQGGGLVPGNSNLPVNVTASGAANSFNTLAKPFAGDPSASRPSQGAESKAEIPLEEILPKHDNTFGFIELKDATVLPSSHITVRVKGTAGATFKLLVNGDEVPDTRIGKRAVLQEKQSQAWEYIGIALKEGVNELKALQYDTFGNARGEAKVSVKAPGELARIRLSFGEKVRANGGAVADGKTPVKVVVSLVDKNDLPVTTRLPATLSASVGRWQVEDLNLSDPGVQVFIEGGRAEFTLLPPGEPTQSRLVVESGRIRADEKLDFLPDLRELIAAGVIEGVLNLRKLDSRALVPTREQDSFEREIKHLSHTWNNGKTQSAARAAMFLKGKIKGEYLLTLAYDSDKDTRERLFRDIQPDEFYPVYGDSSVRTFDAQSTGRLYLRVDHKKSYLLYGDYNTASSAENRQLSNYNRSLTGIKQHYESSKVSANFFASRDSTKQVVQEFPANGTSGPFTLANARGLINSEKLEVLTRDRNRVSLILKAVPLIRFVDYEIESLTGRILLKAPIASLDEDLNPQSLRVTYEVDQGGDEFWVAGADAQVKVTDRLELGAVIVDDRNPVEKFRLAGVNAVAKLADKSFFIAEIARTSREKFALGQSLGETSGLARRAELKHATGDFEGNIFVARADSGFDNLNASISKARTEAGGKMTYRLNDKTRVKGELLSTSDDVTHAKREGILLGIERTLGMGLRAELAVRHARDTQYAPVTAPGGVVPKDSKNEVTTVRARMTGDVPQLKGLSTYAEAEVDVQDSARKVLAAGADYQLPNNGRLYARHEFASSITGPYGLNNQQRQNATVFGVNADYMKDGNVFSEYRIRDAISGGDAEAALGLRNMWTLAEGVKLQTGFERVHAMSGPGNAESSALTFGLEYTANPLWKASSRLELREGKSQDSILSTIAIASKLSRNWTFLGRNTISILQNKGQVLGENRQSRMQAGLAYRDTDDDIWNALARVERRTEDDTTQTDMSLKRTVELVSLHANWQPVKPFTFSARYAAKRVNEQSNGIHSSNNAQLLGGRMVWEVAPRWDVSVQASTMFGRGTAAKQYGLGVELGFMVMENLWLSAGYNWFGYRDADLTASDYTNKGVFVRVRYKFDEDLFAKSATPLSRVDPKMATPDKVNSADKNPPL
jgi:uncharacterized repeat protein (TIGR01451 family)